MFAINMNNLSQNLSINLPKLSKVATKARLKPPGHISLKAPNVELKLYVCVEYVIKT